MAEVWQLSRSESWSRMHRATWMNGPVSHHSLHSPFSYPSYTSLISYPDLLTLRKIEMSTRVQSKDLKKIKERANVVHATCIVQFSLTNQIKERDRFCQMYSAKANIWVRDLCFLYSMDGKKKSFRRQKINVQKRLIRKLSLF